MKKLITLATAASLIMGSMAVPVYGAAFADINTVTWSGFKPFIEQAAELGLMSGYNENGKKYCKPRNNVTYCEAVQLMYSIMRVYSGRDVSDTTVTKWKPVISAYNIPDWAYKATAYALENSILTTSDLNKLQGNANKINTKAANREDVGVIFGKALDTVNGYDTKSGATLSYKDKGSVSAASVPYLELLNRANLMVGDTDNKFNPKANISRAEMAVLSVKTYNKLTETGTQTPVTSQKTAAGTVTTSSVMQNGDLFVVVKASTGENLSLFGTVGKATAKYDGEKIGFKDIGEGDTVKVTYEGTTLSAIEVVYSKAGISGVKEEEEKNTTEETFELVDISERKITVKDGKDEEEYYLDDDVKITLEGKKSSVNKVLDALEEAEYDVILTLDEDEYVLEAEIVLNDNNPTEGYVDDVDEKEITIKVGSKKYTYDLADDLDIEYDGKSMTFSKFEKNYDDGNFYVSMELNDDGEVEEIVVESMEDEFTGTLTYLGSKKLKFESGGDEYTYDFADDMEVEIDGKGSTLAKLQKAFKDDEKSFTVTVELDRDDEVELLSAKSKSAKNNEGDLEDIDEDEITIIADEKKYTYDIADDVDVEINGKNRDVDDLIDYLGEYKFEVKLEFDKDDEVSLIEATLTEASEGELKDIVESKNKLTISAASLNIELTLASDVEVTLGGEEITLAKLNKELDYIGGGANIYVELEFDKNGEVETITAHWEDVVGELVAVDEEDEVITVKVGKREEYELGRRAEFVFKLGTSVDKDDYKKLSKYDNDIEGLLAFLEDCEDAGDTCMVALTLDDEYVVRVKATAE